MKNEKSIHETILSLREKVTIVIIAHRLSTVENCDSVIWLDKGHVLSWCLAWVLQQSQGCESVGPGWQGIP